MLGLGRRRIGGSPGAPSSSRGLGVLADLEPPAQIRIRCDSSSPEGSCAHHPARRGSGARREGVVLENDREVNRIFYTAHVQLLVSLVFFVFFPVRMPRELFYGAHVYNWADAFWRWFDAPNNCFPSLHVSNILLLLQFHWRRPHRVLHGGLGIAIIASTVLVKQHYLVDLLGGAI